MNNQRWQVLHVATCLGHRWVAQPEEEGPGTVFDTWREAMDYADRMSRTIEVELPRNPHRLIDVEIQREMEHIPTDFGHVTVGAEHEMTIRYWRKSPEEVALALLALARHYKNQDTQ